MRRTDIQDVNGRSARRWGPWIVVGLGAAVAAAVLALWTPPDDPRLTVCLLRRSTGVDCPGCGMTRALSALVHGEWALSWRLHPLSIPVAIEAVGLWLGWGWALLRRKPLPGGRFWGVLVTVHVVAFLAVWIVRAL